VIATIPAVIFGFAFKDLVATEWRSITVIATTTAVFGILLFVADRTKQARITSEFDLSWVIVCLVGLAQAIAIIPGTSRSGITITIALFLGVAPAAAARFSFLLSIPTISGAALLLGLDAYMDSSVGGVANNWSDLFAGFVLSGIAAYFGIHYFIALLERTGMTPYVIYRLVLAAVLAFLLL
jgi:undecaprenyl-diphosphatase